MSVQTYISMGSNLGDSRQILHAAIEQMKTLSSDDDIKVSSFYKTQPLGPQDQPDYLNAVAGLQTDLSAIELLDALQSIEQIHHRQRGKEQWGPRTLDLDILLYADERIHEERLVVPHPHMHERRFVLEPLYELAGDMDIPGKDRISALLKTSEDLTVEKFNESA